MRNYYKVETLNGEILVLERDGIISFVPEDEANPDYQIYLNPELEQNGTIS
jgi:hypothetical protein